MAHEPILGLSEAHYQELATGSAIRREVMIQRYYQTVEAEDLPKQFAEYQKRAGLIIPLRNTEGKIVSYQLKPDQPRLDKHGKPIKYETAADCPQTIDVPLACTKMMGDPAMPLVITEGAKKVDAGLSHGLKCIIGLQGVYGWRGTNEQGGKTALPDWEQIALNQRRVLIAFDSDVMTKASVRTALERLASFLTSKGAKVSYLLLPNLADGSKCGLDDWFASGKTRDEMQQYVSLTLPPLAPPAPITSIASLRMRYLHEVETKPIDWLWPNWLPKGMLTLLGGYAGDGKSTLTMAIAAALSTGGQLPDGTTAPVTNTLLVLAEDDISHVVKGRLDVHGADNHRIITLDDVNTGDGSTRSFNLRTDVPLLRQAVEQHGIGLIVLDPLSSVLSASDRNNEGEVRDALAPLVQMMEETGVAVIGIMHIGKNDGQARAFQKLMGSTAFTALARSVWMVTDLPDEFQAEGEPTRKMLGVAKSNYAVAPHPIRFCRPLDSALEWLGECPIRIEEAFSWKSTSERQSAPTETDKAEEWLLAFMDGQRVLATEIETAAKAEGIAMRTLKTAKKHLGLLSVRENNQWWWLPQRPADENVA